MDNITKLIEASGKSRRDISVEADISQPMLSLIENGHRKVGMKSIVPLANALGCSPAKLRPDIWKAMVG